MRKVVENVTQNLISVDDLTAETLDNKLYVTFDPDDPYFFSVATWEYDGVTELCSDTSDHCGFRYVNIEELRGSFGFEPQSYVCDDWFDVFELYQKRKDGCLP